jgi:hypothetical protein
LEIKDFYFTVDLNGKLIELNYLPVSRRLLVWLDKEHEPPTVLDIDYENMAKAKQDFCEIFNGHGNDEHVKNAWSKFTELLGPCMYEYYQVHRDKDDDDNDNGLTDKYAQSLNNASKPVLKSDEDELAEIPNRDYAGYVINTVKKEVKRDDVLVRQVFYTALSAYTFDPLNLGILCPTSEGKTYTTMKVMQYFPKEDVWLIGQMSNKALVRQKGILINSKGESIQEQIDKLRIELRDTNTVTLRFEAPTGKPEVDPTTGKELTVQQKVEKRKAEIKGKLNRLLDDATTLINLQGKILVFLEPPQRELWNLIKPILSHDTTEISYDYVDRSERGGFQTQRVIVRGFPAVIFCSAKDESKWEIWDEIQSRFLITSPNMNQAKVHDGNVLISQRKGLPNWRQQELIVSDKERELARKTVSYLKGWMHRLSQSNMLDYEHQNAVWIPYAFILANALKSERGTDNRITERIFSLLNIIALAKVHHRQTLVYGNERLVIATLEDLSETLHITQNLSGIPPHKLKFYKEIFLPLYQSKTGPDVSSDGSKTEDNRGIRTSEMREFYKSKTGKSTTTQNITNSYLNELENNGFVDKQDSQIDQRQKIYFPIVEIPKEQKIKKLVSDGPLTNFLQHSKIIPSKYFKKIPKDWLEVAISTLKNSLVGKDNNDTFQLIDEHDEETSIPEFVKNYSKGVNLSNYFVEPNFSNNYNDNTEGMKFLYGSESE